MKLLAEMGFDSKVIKPTKETEKELRSALQQYIIENDRSALTKRIEGILYLLDQGKYKQLLDPGPHEFAYRFMDANGAGPMSKILGKPLRPSTDCVPIEAGILDPDDRGLSSWTVNPRSLVYSGFFSVLDPNSSLCLVKAKISSNRFFGNPDELVSHLDFPADYYAPGYALEREVVAVGPVAYGTGVFQSRDLKRSLEGQAMDLINALDPLDQKEPSDWDEEYYFPKF
jgi:hypothetical protein